MAPLGTGIMRSFTYEALGNVVKNSWPISTPSAVPDMYRAAPMTTEQFRHLEDELPHVFPEFPPQHALLTVTKEQPSDAASGKVALYVPNKLRHAAWFEDLDYSSPIWMNLLALPLAALHMFLTSLR